MIRKTIIICLLSCFNFLSVEVCAQTAAIEGILKSSGSEIELVAVQIMETDKYILSNEEGYFRFDSLKAGKYTLLFKRIGYHQQIEEIELTKGESKYVEIELAEDRLNLNEVVVSATRYELDRKESPLIVNVLKPRTLQAANAYSISEGLVYQPGVRVEMNCQNCGFNQVRLNGLDGAYSQILINGRAVFSALNSVYGLEQIPSNIVERVEILRGGGSSLYGSNAIAGTINIITREPQFNAWNVGSAVSMIDGEVPDYNTNFNVSFSDDNLRKGLTIYGMKRNREAFDANDDGFSELTKIDALSIGSKAFWKTGDLSKISFDVSYINEYRRGGDRLELMPHLTDITEELLHNTIFYGLEYEQFLDRDKRKSITSYISGQFTERDSYYGGLGGGRTSFDSLFALNAYGNTSDMAIVSGFQFNERLRSGNYFTIGIENQQNMVTDRIPGYQREIIQKTNNTGIFAQYEWNFNSRLKLHPGLRFDIAGVNSDNSLEKIQRVQNETFYVLSPRISALYDLLPNLNFRLSYARGFRTPQAFNEDLHISSVAGEPRFVILGEDLSRESSDAYTASLNWNRSRGTWQYDVLLEGFYTILKNPFTLVNTGSQLENGSIIEEMRNGTGAEVRGINIELNASPSNDFIIQNGFTIQNSAYQDPQLLFESENNPHENVRIQSFMRTPDLYGYSSLNYKPLEWFSLDFTGSYTGEMIVPRIISENGDLELVRSPDFFDANVKLSYHLDLREHLILNFAIGMQNIFDSYQRDFSSGPLRDSNYIYGPSRPRTIFFSLNLSNFHL